MKSTASAARMLTIADCITERPAITIITTSVTIGSSNSHPSRKTLPSRGMSSLGVALRPSLMASKSITNHIAVK